MRYLVLPPPPPRKYVRALLAATRTTLLLAAWNALFAMAGLLLIALAGEVYFRLTRPFIETNAPVKFVERVGLIREPNAELRYANWREDNYVVSRANSQGFLDREPIGAERAAEGCHIAFIGDSFVEAKEVASAYKFHARLEEMAARELPYLGITTQAYGIANTGQINQLPFYDEYARGLSPKLVVLVFYLNDFADNSIALQALNIGADPARMPYMSAQRDAHGVMTLRPPDPEYRRFRLPRPPKPPQVWHASALKRLVRVSHFAKWAETEGLIRIKASVIPESRFMAWADMIAERPCCASLADGWQPSGGWDLARKFTEESLPPVFDEALAYTAFGVEQFKRRTDRDGATLIVLAATRDMGTRGDPQFERLSAIAEARGIPVISDYAYIVSQGRDAWGGRWLEGHWNAVGHQWAAEAVLEWLKANRGVCE